MGTVTVCGTATASVTPDLVVVSLGLTHVAADAGTAVDAVAERSRRLSDLLERAGFDRSSWTTEGVRVSEEWEYRDNSNVRVGHRADAGVAVTVTDLESVGRLISDAVAEAEAAVRSLDWRVLPGNPVHRSLRTAAAVDARERAATYSEALGASLGSIEAISELPLTQVGGPPPVPMMMAARAKSADAAVDVSAGQITLTADVHVRFTLLP